MAGSDVYPCKAKAQRHRGCKGYTGYKRYRGEYPLCHSFETGVRVGVGAGFETAANLVHGRRQDPAEEGGHQDGFAAGGGDADTARGSELWWGIRKELPGGEPFWTPTHAEYNAACGLPSR